MDINHIQIGFSSLATVLFIQCQRPWRTGLLLTQPRLGALTCFFDDAGNLPQTDLDPMQVLQTRLNASITGMRVDQQSQGQGGKRGSLLRSPLASQRFFQCSLPCHRPTIQGLTRDMMRTTQLADQPVWGLRQHLADHLNALPNSATMVHVSSLGTVVFFRLSLYLSGSLFVHFFRQLSHWFKLNLNHA